MKKLLQVTFHFKAEKVAGLLINHDKSFVLSPGAELRPEHVKAIKRIEKDAHTWEITAINLEDNTTAGQFIRLDSHVVKNGCLAGIEEDVAVSVIRACLEVIS